MYDAPKPDPLTARWFERDAIAVARELIGAHLCRSAGNMPEVSRYQIVEVEAYTGPDDRACHAHRGRTKRTGVMFGPPGRAYVYLCYGVHWMLNVVTGPVGHPAAVLIRGVMGISGPGRLTKALRIDGELNGMALDVAGGLWLERGDPVREESVLRTPRIGVNYAGPDWSQRPYRFVLRD